MTDDGGIEMQWYYCVAANERKGPIEEEEIFRLARDGVLTPESIVWNETMGSEWVSASSVKGMVFEGDVDVSVDASDAEVCGEGDGDAPVAAVGVDAVLAEKSSGGVPYAEYVDVDPVEPLVRNYGDQITLSGPVGVAWRRMKLILFCPFDIGKWFALGFSAWLATLLQGGGGNSSFRWSNGSGGPFDTSKDDFSDWDSMLTAARDGWAAYGTIIVAVSCVVVVVGFLLTALFYWIQSRGKFMLLDNVVNNRCKISDPWRKYARLGNSLCIWNVVYRFVCTTFWIVFLVVSALFIGVPCLKAGAFVAAVWPVIGVLGTVAFVVGIVCSYVQRFLEDFVVPIMYRQDVGTMQAWKRFQVLLNAHFWKFVLYGLFYMVLGFASGLAVGLFIVCTLCIACCPLMLPYVGTVLMLPVFVFFRSYSIEYLAQYGAEFDAMIVD